MNDDVTRDERSRDEQPDRALCASLARHDHLDVCDPLARDAPELRHRSRAQRGTLSGGEHPGEPLSLARQRPVADRVDRAVDAMQASLLDAFGHGTRVETQRA